MKKTTVKHPVKKTSKKASKKTTVINHLQPIDDILSWMEACEIKLKHLLDTIPKKLEKLAIAAKSKVTKTLAQHKKASVSHRAVLKKHKAKSTPLTQAGIKKAEKVISEIATSLEHFKNEYANLVTQLTICKDMKKTFAATSQSPAKPKRAQKTSAKKSVSKKENTATAKKISETLH